MSELNKLVEDNISIHLSKITLKVLTDISDIYKINKKILIDEWNKMEKYNINLKVEKEDASSKVKELKEIYIESDSE